MKVVLLDTSALMAHFRDEHGAERVQAIFDSEENQVLVCSVSLPEMSRRVRELGAAPSDAWETVGFYQDLIDEVVPVDAWVAEQAERLSVASKHRLPMVDALIAAAAAVREATLVHRDAHMRGLPSRLVRQLDLS